MLNLETDILFMLNATPAHKRISAVGVSRNIKGKKSGELTVYCYFENSGNKMTYF